MNCLFLILKIKYPIYTNHPSLFLDQNMKILNLEKCNVRNVI